MADALSDASNMLMRAGAVGLGQEMQNEAQKKKAQQQLPLSAYIMDKILPARSTGKISENQAMIMTAKKGLELGVAPDDSYRLLGLNMKNYGALKNRGLNYIDQMKAAKAQLDIKGKALTNIQKQQAIEKSGQGPLAQQAFKAASTTLKGFRGIANAARAAKDLPEKDRVEAVAKSLQAKLGAGEGGVIDLEDIETVEALASKLADYLQETDESFSPYKREDLILSLSQLINGGSAESAARSIGIPTGQNLSRSDEIQNRAAQAALAKLRK